MHLHSVNAHVHLFGKEKCSKSGGIVFAEVDVLRDRSDHVVVKYCSY